MCSTEPAMDPAIMYCQNNRPSWVGGGDTDISVWNSGDVGMPRNFWEASVAMVVESGEWYQSWGLKERMNDCDFQIAFSLNRNGLSPCTNYCGSLSDI